MRHSKRLRNNLKWIAIGTYVTNIISLFVSVYIIRELSVEEFGIYSMFLGLITLFSVFSSSGIIVSTRRFIPELFQKRAYKYLKSMIFKLRLSSTLISIFLLIIVYVFRLKLGTLFNIPNFGRLYKLFMVNIFLFLQKGLYNVDLVAFHKQKLYTKLHILSSIIRGILYLLLIPRISIEIIFIIEAVTLSVIVIPSFVYSLLFYSKLPNTNELKDNHSNINVYNKRIIRYSLFSFSNEMGANILSEISDYYLISAFLGPASLGLYAFPNKVLKILLRWIPVTRIVNMIRPIYLSKYYEKNESKEILQEMFDFIVKCIFIIYSIVIGYAILYQEVIVDYIFSSKYENSFNLFVVIFLSYFFSFFIHPVNLVMEATENIQYNLYSKIAAIFNVFVVVIILKFTNLGAIGVALGTGLSNFIKNYYIYYFMKKKVKIQFDKSMLFRLFIISFVFGLFIAISYHLISNLWIKIIVTFIGGCGIYLFLLLKFRIFVGREKQLIDKILNTGKITKKVRRFCEYIN